MKRIDTPTADPNLFGLGLAGFDDLAGVAGTELNASFFNNGQETLCRAITGQGLLLDGANYDQLTEAINIWSTFETIAIANGGTFTLKDSSVLVVEADGGNGGSAISVGGAVAIQNGGVLAVLLGGTVDVQSGSMIDVKSGATLEADAGSIVNFNSVVNASAGIQAAAATPVNLPEGATVPATKSITGAGSTSTDLHVGDSFELDSETAATGDRQIHHLGGEPRWKDSSDDFIHHGVEPWGPIPSVPALDSFGPTSIELDGPTVEVTLVGTAFIFVTATGVLLGTTGDTEAGIRVDVDGVDIYNQTFDVFNTGSPLPWSTSFAIQKGAGTYDVKIKFRRSAGTGSVNLVASSIFAMPT